MHREQKLSYYVNEVCGGPTHLSNDTWMQNEWQDKGEQCFDTM